MKSLYITITNECNLRCPHCYKEDFKTSFLEPNKVRRFLDDHPEIDHVILYGGEFLLERYSKKVLNLLFTLKGHGLKVSGTTNLCFTSLSDQQKSILSNLDAISTSWNPGRFTKLQFDNWVKNLEFIKPENSTLLITLTKSLVILDPVVIHHLPLDKFDTVKFEPFIGEGPERPDNKKVDEWLCKFFASVENPYKFEPFSSIRKMFETNDSQGTFRRRCFDESLCMEVDGSLKICPNDSSFLTAENSKELQARFFEFDKKCYKCKYFSLCKGNCILLKKDKSGCAGYPMLFKTIQRSLKNGN